MDSKRFRHPLAREPTADASIDCSVRARILRGYHFDFAGNCRFLARLRLPFVPQDESVLGHEHAEMITPTPTAAILQICFELEAKSLSSHPTHVAVNQFSRA